MTEDFSTATLMIISDDPDEAVIAVAQFGLGVEAEVSPLEQIQQIGVFKLGRIWNWDFLVFSPHKLERFVQKWTKLNAEIKHA